MDYYHNENRGNIEVINDISRAIHGEYHAIYCYEQLASQAPNDEIRNRILEIRNDEMTHFHQFSHIYTCLTGRMPTPELTEGCQADFESGVRASFIDEQQTSHFYQNIARKTNDPVIKETFTRAAADEQNHAVWFLYYLDNE